MLAIPNRGSHKTPLDTNVVMYGVPPALATFVAYQFEVNAGYVSCSWLDNRQQLTGMERAQQRREELCRISCLPEVQQSTQSCTWRLSFTT